MTAIVTQGDAGNLPLPDATVDLVVTSPPYFGLRSYTDGGQHYSEQIGAEATPAEYLDALMACTAEWMRVLKPGGSIFVNLGDKYAGSAPGRRDKESIKKLDAQTGRTRVSDHWAPQEVPTKVGWGGVPAKSLCGLPWRYAIRCIDELGLILRAEIVWAKPNGLPESVTDRVRRSHEQVFHFTKSPRYYSAVDTIREWSGDSGSSPSSPAARGAGSGRPAGRPPATASSNSVVARCSPTELPTSCTWDPSLLACTSTTCAATASAATRHTSNPSPCKRTCSAARGLSQPSTQLRLTAPTGTSSMTPTPTSSPETAAACAACACEPATAPATGGLGKLPGSVWSIPTSPLRVPDWLEVDHFAAYPPELVRRIILGWSPRDVCTACGEGRRPITTSMGLEQGTRGGSPAARLTAAYDTGQRHGSNGSTLGFQRIRQITGYACACPDTTAPTTPGVVLDPFGGTGTTALVASVHGRVGISNDLSADYCRLARWRTTDDKQRDKAAGIKPKTTKKPKPEPVADVLELPVPDGQLDLLDGEAS